MKHLGNLALFGLFAALLTIPLIGFGFLDYAEVPVLAPGETNVLPAESVRVLPEVEEVSESTEATNLDL